MGNTKSSSESDSLSTDVVVSIQAIPPKGFRVVKHLGKVVAYSKTYSRSSGQDDESLKEVIQECRQYCTRLGGNCILGVQVQTEAVGKSGNRVRLVLKGDIVRTETHHPSGEEGNETPQPSPEPSTAVHVIHGKRSRQHLRDAVGDVVEGLGGGLSILP